MLIRLLIGYLCLGMFSLCHLLTPTKPIDEDNSVTAIEKNTTTTLVKIIRYQSGKTTEFSPPTPSSQTMIDLALTLLADAEPMRLYLEETSMQAIEHPQDGFEMQFLPPYRTAADAPALHKLLFLQSGDYATGKTTDRDAVFFVALADNYAYIRSPFVREQGGTKAAQLMQLMADNNP